MTDDELEQRLREALARRAATSADAALRARVLDVTTPSVARHATVPWEGVAAAVAVAVAAVLVLTFLLRPIVPGPAGRPAPAPHTGLVPGDGLAGPTLGLGFLLLCGVVVVVGVGIVWRLRTVLRTGPARGAALVAIVVLIAVARSYGDSIALGEGSVFVEGLGWQQTVPNGPTEAAYFPGDGGTFSFGMAIANTGPVSITIKGLARPDSPQFNVALVGLGRSPTPLDLSNGNELVVDPSKLVPFEPVTLAPGEETFITVLGQAGSCALAPGDAYEVWQGPAEVPLVVEVAGYEWIDAVPTFEPVKIAMRKGCGDTEPIPVP